MKYSEPQMSVLAQLDGLKKSSRELYLYLRGVDTEAGPRDLSSRPVKSLPL